MVICNNGDSLLSQAYVSTKGSADIPKVTSSVFPAMSRSPIKPSVETSFENHQPTYAITNNYIQSHVFNLYYVGRHRPWVSYNVC